MAEADLSGNLRSAEAIFDDHRRRRDGILRALTTDVERFFEQCNPNEGQLCLYGTLTSSWEVKPPPKEFQEVPVPTAGINLARIGGTGRHQWLEKVAIQSHLWLISLAFYHTAICKLDKDSRNRLYSLINALPPLYEMLGVEAAEDKIEKEADAAEDESKEEEEAEDVFVVCIGCGMPFESGDFWVVCENCQANFCHTCAKTNKKRYFKSSSHWCSDCKAHCLPRH